MVSSGVRGHSKSFVNGELLKFQKFSDSAVFSLDEGNDPVKLKNVAVMFYTAGVLYIISIVVLIIEILYSTIERN